MTKLEKGLMLARWWLQASGQSFSDEEIKNFYSQAEIESWGETYQYADSSDLLKAFQDFAKDSESKGLNNIGLAIIRAGQYAAGTYTGFSGAWNAVKNTVSDLTETGAAAASQLGSAAFTGVSGLLRFLPVVAIIALIGIVFIYAPKLPKGKSA